MRPALTMFALLLMPAVPGVAQTIVVAPAVLPKGISRVAGNDQDSGIVFTLLSVEGRLTSSVGPLPPRAPKPQVPEQPKPAPRLTAQCTRAGDKFKFELLVDFGGLPEPVFTAPWRPGQGTLFEPPIQRMMATIEFLGYVKEKPVKRQFDLLEGAMAGVMRYSTPGLNTSNLEPVAYYMQFLKALPTLRLSAPGKGIVEFETLPWQAVVRAEPLCRMAGL